MSSSSVAATPVPTSSPQCSLPSITVQELHEFIDSSTGGQRDFLVVDVRRTDIEGDMSFLIPGAINLPAQTFQAALPALLPILTLYRKVIFHCSSSRGRGPRCAGWYQDELDRKGEKGSAAYVLEGGIKAWKESYGEEMVHVAS